MVNQHEESIRSLNEQIQTINEQHQAEVREILFFEIFIHFSFQLIQSNERYDELLNEKNQVLQQLQSVEQTLTENEQLKEKLNEVIQDGLRL